MPQTRPALAPTALEPDGPRDRILCQIPLHDLVVASFSHGLANLVAQLDKATKDADRRGESPEALLDARLAPHMPSLAQEIGLACQQARDCVAALFGEAPPRPPRTDTPARVRDAIEATLAELWECDRSRLDAASRRAVTLELPDGDTFDLGGRQYVRDWAVPQFYLHLVSAYAILRARGAPVGDADYAAHMIRYLRPSSQERPDAV